MEIAKFTTRTQEAIAAAIQAATGAGHSQLEAIHLLASLLDQDQTLVKPLLEAAGVQPSAVAGSVQAELRRLPAASGSPAGPDGGRRPIWPPCCPTPSCATGSTAQRRSCRPTSTRKRSPRRWAGSRALSATSSSPARMTPRTAA